MKLRRLITKRNNRSTLETSFEPKSDLELAKLHRIDLTKYKISTYWSKLQTIGNFTSSVFASLKKPNEYSPEDLVAFLKSLPQSQLKNLKNLNDKTKENIDAELSIADYQQKKVVEGCNDPAQKQ
jgi:hypothetical protein